MGILDRRIRALLGGVEAGQRFGLNFIQGTGMTVTLTDDPSNNKVDVTLASSGGAGTVSSVFGRTGAVVATAGDYTGIAVGGVADTVALGAVTPPMLAFKPEFLAYIAGGVYAPEGVTSTGALTTQNTGVFSRIWLEPRAISALGVNVTANVASSLIRLGLFASDTSTGLPSGTPLIDAGQVSGASIAYVTAAVSYTPPVAGWYWVCADRQSTGSPTVTTLASTNRLSGMPGLTTGNFGGVGLVSASFASGAFPTATGITLVAGMGVLVTVTLT